MQRRAIVIVFAVLALLWRPHTVAATTINFESLRDTEFISTQFPGLTFSNAITLTAGISLNEFEFPPLPGVRNVASDRGGPISILFADPVSSFGGFFTYSVPLTLSFFDPMGLLLGTTSSAFSSNMALSGVRGSSPNEFLELAFATGIGRVTIAGLPTGGSFTLGAATFEPAAPVPEPATGALLGIGAVALAIRKRLVRAHSSPDGSDAARRTGA